MHERIHGGVRAEVCKVCQKAFAHPSTLQKHMKYVHRRNEDREQAMKPFSCRRCGKQFARKGSLVKHLELHLKVKEREVIRCSVDGCSKTFSSNSNRNRHVRVVHAHANVSVCEIN